MPVKRSSSEQWFLETIFIHVFQEILFTTFDPWGYGPYSKNSVREIRKLAGSLGVNLLSPRDYYERMSTSPREEDRKQAEVLKAKYL